MILGALAFLILLTFPHYGITWDEELQSQYGLAIVDYYASGFKDQRFAEIFNLYLYGGMFDGLASLIDRLTPFRIYETRHLLNALFGLLGLWGTWRLGRRVSGERVGLLALVITALTPMYYGHMFNNPKDIPFAAAVIFTIEAMVRIYQNLPHPPLKLVARLGLFLGLMLGVRVGGVMIVAFWLATLGLGFLSRLTTRNILQSAISYLRIVLPVLLLATMVMFVCWPWAQQDPLHNPWKALVQFSNFPQDVEVQLAGVTYRSTQLPWYYVPLYFLVQLPEYFLGLLLASIPFAYRVYHKRSPAQRLGLLTVALSIIVPLAYAMLRHPALYDAVRHFLFVVPLLAILIACGAYEAVRAARLLALKHHRLHACDTLLLLGIVLTIGWHVSVLIRLHPYEYIYVNSFFGGPSGAFGKYELDYWGSSFKEAAADLQQLVQKEGGIPDGKIYRIAICGPWDAAMIYLPPDYEPVVANLPAEFFLSTTRWQCQNMRRGKEIIRVERMGAPLAIIKDLRENNPPH